MSHAIQFRIVMSYDGEQLKETRFYPLTAAAVSWLQKHDRRSLSRGFVRYIYTTSDEVRRVMAKIEQAGKVVSKMKEINS